MDTDWTTNYQGIKKTASITKLPENDKQKHQQQTALGNMDTSALEGIALVDTAKQVTTLCEEVKLNATGGSLPGEGKKDLQGALIERTCFSADPLIGSPNDLSPVLLDPLESL